MATLTRVTGKVFGGDAPLDQIGQFGSALAGTKLNTKDIATIQALEAYSKGWGSAILTSRNFPPIEEVNGVLNTLSYQICYLLQEGCPTYDINTEYSATSVVKMVSGSTLNYYISQQDNNIGHPLTDTNYWKPAIFTGTGAIGAPQFTLNVNAILPENCIWLEGAEVSRTDYNNLFAIFGTTYGTGDGSTTFNLPDFRNRYICGLDTDLAAGYVSAGLPDLGLQTTSSGAHKHSRGSMNIQGQIGFSGIDPNTSWAYASGAFTKNNQSGAGNSHDNPVNGAYVDFYFNASRNWTGETSSNGAHTHTITSNNAIVGSTSTITSIVCPLFARTSVNSVIGFPSLSLTLVKYLHPFSSISLK